MAYSHDQNQNGSERHETRIQADKSLLHIDWKEMLYYRDLLFILVMRDIVSKYKQTILGPMWLIIQPLLMTLVFTVVFGKAAKISTDNIPPILFYMSGLLTWRYFSSCLEVTSTTFVANMDLFGKVYFPRLIVPFSVVISNLFAFAIQLGTFLLFYFYFKYFTPAGKIIQPNSLLFLLPLFLVQTALISMGVGLWVSALTAKYRDLRFIMGFLTQIWMYLTPIIYPISMIPERWRFVMAFNPMASIVEVYRYAFFGQGSVRANYVMVSVLVTLVISITGIFIFNKKSRTFIDTV